MGRVDCSLTLNYTQEFNRMCKSAGCKCNDCPMYVVVGACDTVGGITQTHIDLVQKWSDEHPQETMTVHFLKLFPKAPTLTGPFGIYPQLCPNDLGWPVTCSTNRDCYACWNRPYTEVQNENL
ncbi:MAG: hypothetical protein IKY90_08915 [Oscillospiraceae bacterium]|nr:hypothetical protein [Oscillospiraceae bacterium]